MWTSRLSSNHIGNMYIYIYIYNYLKKGGNPAEYISTNEHVYHRTRAGKKGYCSRDQYLDFSDTVFIWVLNISWRPK